MNTPRITIAIDGYSSSGKSSMARQLARALGYRYVDSGAMYRAVTLAAMRQGAINHDGSVNSEALCQILPDIHIDFATEAGQQYTLLNGENVESQIRSMEVSSHVSAVAALGMVRKAMVALQKSYGTEGGIIMDGRDIGTAVFPAAEIKIFVNASAETRARRRYLELQAKGDTATTYAEVLDNVISRDHIDETRAESPLRRADDAIDLDNSDMTIEQQNQWLLDLYNRTIARLQA